MRWRESFRRAEFDGLKWTPGQFPLEAFVLAEGAFPRGVEEPVADSCPADFAGQVLERRQHRKVMAHRERDVTLVSDLEDFRVVVELDLHVDAVVVDFTGSITIPADAGRAEPRLFWLGRGPGGSGAGLRWWRGPREIVRPLWFRRGSSGSDRAKHRFAD